MKLATLFVLLSGFSATIASAQTSASYRLSENVINAGGTPMQSSIHSSANFRIRLDAIGDGVIGQTGSSASFRADGGFVGSYPPPGEVFELRFTSRTTLSWNPERSVGSYDVYRNLVGTLPGDYGSCFASAIGTNGTTDASSPGVGRSWFYLVTARNRLREEGTKGKASNGTDRPNPVPCP